jgi:hypothetical protein
VLAPLNKINAVVRRGESVRVEVVVRTRKVGHFFPGGTVDAFDVWVELEAVDDKGRVLLHSGAVESAQVNRWLVDAEDSVDEWTAPGRRGLGLREVAHFLVMSRYRDKGKPGAQVSFGAIVNALVPENL